MNYASLARLYLGGGGGAGHGNNGSTGGCSGGGGSGAGGNGGAIIIILANTIEGNGYSIVSEGVDGGNSVGDGAGGGGAGGVIFLNVINYVGTLTLDISGGNGGNSDNAVDDRCYGPGGGGGAGAILSNIPLPGTILTDLLGGTAGYMLNSTTTCNGSQGTAANAGSGTVLTGVSVPQGTANPSSGCGLPVTFIHFTGRAFNKQIELKWATATEFDADYFSIERSSNQVDFYEIGRVAAAGNTTTRTDYQLMDPFPYPGTNYYRIRQVDVTGFEKFTSVIAVSPQINNLVQNLFPNPVGSGQTLQLAFTDPELDHDILLTDISGRVMRRWHRGRNPDAVEKLLVPQGLSGIYMLIIRTAERVQVLKLAVE
jgi:hypothetical protein